MVAFPSSQLAGVGFSSTYTVSGGRLIEDHNLAYFTPYQIKYAGLYLAIRKSSDYDATATSPVLPVAVPAGTGVLAEGWSYMTTAVTNALPGAAVSYRPTDAQVAGSGYSDDITEWIPITVCPVREGEKVGVPVYAGYNVAVGDEIAVATGGFAKVAASGDYVMGKAESAANNSTGVSGAIFVAVKHGQAYKKA